jgi:hypothetical protein
MKIIIIECNRLNIEIIIKIEMTHSKHYHSYWVILTSNARYVLDSLLLYCDTDELIEKTILLFLHSLIAITIDAYIDSRTCQMNTIIREKHPKGCPILFISP